SEPVPRFPPLRVVGHLPPVSVASSICGRCPTTLSRSRHQMSERQSTRLIAAESLDSGLSNPFHTGDARIKVGDVAAPRWGGQRGSEDIDDGTRCPPSDIQNAIEWNGNPRQDWVDEQGHGEASLRASGQAGRRWTHCAPTASPSL